MNVPSLESKFASPERAPEQDVIEASNKVSSTAFLVNTLDQLPIMVFFLNKERQIIFANRLVVEALGLKDRGACLGHRPGELLECIHAGEELAGCGTSEACHTCGVVKAVLVAQEGGNAVSEARIMSKELGASLDLRIWASPFSLFGEKVTMAAMMDISDEKRRGALERIFFHDVINMAGGLLGLTELLEDATSEEQEVFVPTIRRLTFRLLDEIQMQRELTLAERGDLSVQLSNVSAATLLQEVIASYEKHKVAEGKSLQIAGTLQNVMLITDQTLMGRVIGNMVKNALEATPVGTAVTLECRVSGDTAEFSVHNPSVIPREVQLQMFQKSFSTKGKGRGLGTYSMRLLSERYLGGKVTFTSTEEGGTMFKASYPLKLASNE